ncbi:hypothetical protein [Glaciibacter psychrotolerans]|uniref:Transposase InsO family protein n=1 Tax=Glaciibacter psychrotolerans TaxID=670054 RepID=A0A7Z0ED93_9MICO|nr:hypothetical protein [Leifsonia psychrotolerans]NYJ19526.1 transposase InsO family protein [Leifsonia psychrotolerans]
MHRPVELAQYTSIRFTDTVALEGLVASIGSVGDAYDNAAAETVMGLYKNEAVTSQHHALLRRSDRPVFVPVISAWDCLPSSHATNCSS